MIISVPPRPFPIFILKGKCAAILYVYEIIKLTDEAPSNIADKIMKQMVLRKILRVEKNHP